MSPRLLSRSLPTLLLAGAALCAPLQASVLVVTKTTDSADGACNADCSLREAIQAANATGTADTVILAAGTYTLTRAGAGENQAATGDLDVSSEIAVVGAGARATVIDANGLDRAFHVLGDGRLDLLGLTIEGGAVTGNGGGIAVDTANGWLALRQVTVAGNQATGHGGGIFLAGESAIAGSTLANNQAFGKGGGIQVDATGSAELTNSTLFGNHAGTTGGGLNSEENGESALTEVTIVGNSATTNGGGVVGKSTPFLSFSVPVLERSIVADNSAGSDPDCSGIVGSAGHNLVAIACSGYDGDPTDLTGTAGVPLAAGLGSFGDQGGPTDTVALLADSPAVDAADSCSDSDQRGVGRPVGEACDLGAVEYTAACLNDGTTLCLLDGRFAVTVAFATGQGQEGVGRADLLSDESGTFWFFRAENRELFVKVLDACNEFDRFWVFASGLTNVAVTLTVVDTQTGETKVYENPQGEDFVPRLDTGAFATCG